MKRLIMAATVAFFGLSLGACDMIPAYHVYASRQNGLAELAQADGNRQIKVQEAKATAEAASYVADAEITKAKGVATANKIMADSLGGSEGYLRWKYIEMLQDTAGKGQTTIYVPTEASIPIMEAGHRTEAKSGG